MAQCPFSVESLAENLKRRQNVATSRREIQLTDLRTGAVGSLSVVERANANYLSRRKALTAVTVLPVVRMYRKLWAMSVVANMKMARGILVRPNSRNVQVDSTSAIAFLRVLISFHDERPFSGDGGYVLTLTTVPVSTGAAQSFEGSNRTSAPLSHHTGGSIESTGQSRDSPMLLSIFDCAANWALRSEIDVDACARSRRGVQLLQVEHESEDRYEWLQRRYCQLCAGTLLTRGTYQNSDDLVAQHVPLLGNR